MHRILDQFQRCYYRLTRALVDLVCGFHAMDVVSPVDEPTKLRSASSPNIECGFGDLNCSIIPAEIDSAGQTRSVLEPGIVDELVVALDFGAERKGRLASDNAFPPPKRNSVLTSLASSNQELGILG
jgi:hypothetical protein